LNSGRYISGIGSVHTHNTDVTLRYLPQADAVIFVASADQPMSRTELDFLVEIRRYAGKVLCLLNKIDYLSPTEHAESLAFATEAVKRALDTSAPVFAVSARLALQGRAAGDTAMLNNSGLPAFEIALQHFLMEESGAIWQRSMRQHTLRLLNEGRLSAELELRALSSHIDVLDKNLRELAAKKSELLQSASDASAILAAEIREMFAKQITPRLDEFKNKLTPQLHAGLNAWRPGLHNKGAAVSYAELEARMLIEIRSACEIWEAETDAMAQATFGNLCERLMRGIQDGVNEVMLYSANLFNIPFTPINADTLWRSRSRFSIKAWDEPPGLKVLTNALVSMLPAAISNAHILREARRRASDLVDMHKGRLRHEFEERINSNAQAFQRDLVHGIETTLAGIESAIEKGKMLQQLGAVQIPTSRTQRDIGSDSDARRARTARLMTNRRRY
jgi:hypothetical protein